MGIPEIVDSQEPNLYSGQREAQTASLKRGHIGLHGYIGRCFRSKYGAGRTPPEVRARAWSSLAHVVRLCAFTAPRRLALGMRARAREALPLAPSSRMSQHSRRVVAWAASVDVVPGASVDTNPKGTSTRIKQQVKTCRAVACGRLAFAASCPGACAEEGNAIAARDLAWR